MSYWVYLKDVDGNTVNVRNHSEGGTHVVGGTDEAEINVTYNYSVYFPTKTLDGKMAKDTIPMLTEAVAKLGTKRDTDYWKPTKGNVGAMCSILLRWAEMHPEGNWVIH